MPDENCWHVVAVGVIRPITGGAWSSFVIVHVALPPAAIVPEQPAPSVFV